MKGAIGSMGKSTQGTEAEEEGRGQKEVAPRDGGGQTKRLIAMSHPLRARILRLLVERGILSPAELSRELQADLRGVSYHVRRLEELQCVELVETRPVRGALEHFYRATERPMIDTDEFEEIDPIMVEDLVLHTFQRMIDDFVASREAKMVGFDRHLHLSRTPLIVDEEGFEEAMETYEKCRLEMSEIERRSAQRRSSSGAPGIPVCASLSFYKVPPSSLDR